MVDVFIYSVLLLIDFHTVLKSKCFFTMKRLVYVTSFNTVQGFWAVYQHLKLPSHLRQGCDYMFFRSGIQPYWESKENKNGGRVLLEIKKQNRNSELVSKWLETLLALIGEQLSEPSDINGAVVQSRRQADRISVWTRSSDESMRQVAENYQKLVKSSTGLKFQSHLNRTSSLNLRYLGIQTKNYVTKKDILIVTPSNVLGQKWSL